MFAQKGREGNGREGKGRESTTLKIQNATIWRFAPEMPRTLGGFTVLRFQKTQNPENPRRASLAVNYEANFIVLSLGGQISPPPFGKQQPGCSQGHSNVKTTRPFNRSFKALNGLLNSTAASNRLVRPYEPLVGRELPVEPPADPRHHWAVQGISFHTMLFKQQ